MADNVLINQGAQTSIATDDVSGVQFQKIKIDVGGDGLSSPLVRGAQAAANSLPVALATDDAIIAPLGGVTETAPATDTASSGLNGRLQRLAQRVTSLIALLPTALGSNGGLKIEGVAAGTAVPTSLADGSSVTFGAKADAKSAATDTTAITAMSVWKQISASVQSLAAGFALAAGSALIGKVGLDQTTPGTTNLVATISGQNGVAGGSGATGATTQRTVLATDDPLVAKIGNIVTVTTQITRPADTAIYTANDALADSTSAPTSGGFTLTGAARQSGGTGIILDALLGMSTQAGTAVQGELWIFDQSVTAINDNAAFSISDGDRDKLVAIIPFNIDRGGTLNDSFNIQNLNIGFTAIGTANLRFLVKITNAYTPGNAEVFTARLKILQIS